MMTISLTDEAYRRLEIIEREDESFSDVVVRLTESTNPEDRVEELAGELGTEFASAVVDSSDKVRQSLGGGFEG